MASRSSFRFQRQGKAGEHYDCLFNHCRYFLIDLACNIAKSSGKGVVGYNAQTHFVGDQNDRPPVRLKARAPALPWRQPYRVPPPTGSKPQSVRQSTSTTVPGVLYAVIASASSSGGLDG